MKKIDKSMSKNFSSLSSKVQQNTTFLKMLFDPEEIQNLDSNGGIYICTYKPDPRYVYIGKTTDFPRRWKEHSTDFLKSRHCGYFGEFFIENNCSLDDFEWEILDQIASNDQDTLSATEIYRIRQYDNDGYHILLNTQKYRRSKK